MCEILSHTDRRPHVCGGLRSSNRSKEVKTLVVTRNAYWVLLSLVVELGGVQMNGSNQRRGKQKLFFHIRRMKTTKSTMSVASTDHFS